MKNISRFNKITSNYLGKNYKSKEEWTTEVNSNDTTFIIAVINEGRVEYKIMSSVEENIDGKIIGFIRGRLISSVDEYNRIRDFDVFELVNKTELLIESNFPIYNVGVWFVQEEYQGQGIGLQLMLEMGKVIVEKEVFPVIGCLWKHSNNDNSHIELNKSIGGKKIAEYNEFLPEVSCRICSGNCSCSIVIILYTENIVRKVVNSYS